MKGLTQTLGTKPSYAKALEWGKLLTITGSAQLAVQAVGLISGILVIRLLPTQEYALYTLANTMLGGMVILADSGISTSVMAHGAKVWQDRVKLGTVLNIGFELRKKLAFVTLVVVIPGLLFLLHHHNVSWLMSLVIATSLVCALFVALSGLLFQIPSVLNQDITRLQKNDVITNIGRLLLTLLTISAFSWAFVAILASVIPQIWSNRNLKKFSISYADLNQKPDPHIRHEILIFIKKRFPIAVFTCLSGQITIWLASIFGSTVAVAQIGAVGRLSLMLNIFNILFNTLMIPRFARLFEGSKLIIVRFIQIQVGLLILNACIIGMVWLFSTEILWILGEKYSNLNQVLVLNIVGSCLNLIAGASLALYTSRGWIMNPVLSIGINLAVIFLSVNILDMTSVQGIMNLNIVTNAVQVLVNVLFFIKCYNLQRRRFKLNS